MTGFPVHIREWIGSESATQVTVWATSRAEFREEVKDSGLSEEEWVYEGEYEFIFWMNDSGEKIVKTVEFLDSGGMNEVLRSLMARARRNMEAKKSCPREGLY